MSYFQGPYKRAMSDVVQIIANNRHFSKVETGIALLDPIIRDKSDVFLDDAIVILDEAHNVENTCREASSFDFTENEIIATVEELNPKGKILRKARERVATQISNPNSPTERTESVSEALDEVEIHLVVLSGFVKNLHDWFVSTTSTMKVNDDLIGSADEQTARGVFTPRTMYVGLMMAHSKPDAPGTKPSVIGYAANSLDHPGIFRGNYLYQPPSPHETTDALEPIMERLLEQWAQNHNGQMPQKILFLRSGISEGQFKRVSVRGF
uniref:Helicase ATP-binding domain-containing protein n=1 Tax=Steinernema glaseri TaxID=37863 RepID=A0A1I7ZA88_9BILA